MFEFEVVRELHACSRIARMKIVELYIGEYGSLCIKAKMDENKIFLN